MDIKLIIGYSLGALSFAFALYAGYNIGVDRESSILNMLVCVAGGVFGWITGILITPRKNEKKSFSRIGGVLMTFITGFLLAKVDPLLDAQFQIESETTAILTKALLFAVSFGVGALFVFVGRKYWQDS